MNTISESVSIIPLTHLALAFIPVFGVIFIYYRWSMEHGTALYAVLRMLVQLLLIGYVLTYIFDSDSAYIVLIVLVVMVTVSSWIALRTISPTRRKRLYSHTFLALSLSGGFVLFLVSQLVLTSQPWYQPNQVIPLAGMIFANAMNSVSLAIERLEAETERGLAYEKARVIALNAAMIPVINSLFAVGIVLLPGMMTGQILSGVSPLIAVRYQIMVMCMIFGASGLATALFLVLVKKSYQNTRT